MYQTVIQYSNLLRYLITPILLKIMTSSNLRKVLIFKITLILIKVMLDHKVPIVKVEES